MRTGFCGHNMDPGKSDRAITAASRALRCIPERTPGKARVARWAAALLGKTGRIQLADRFGNRLTVPSLQEPIAINLFASGVYEPETLSTCLRLLPSDGVFVDVGANIGAISLPIASARPGGRIVAIEADPRIAVTLRNNVTANRRHNITVVECIAGADDAEVLFYQAPDDRFGMGSIGPQFASSGEHLTQRPLDDVLDKLRIDRVHVVKLDIEGAEARALRGLSRRLSGEHPPAVIFEFSDWAEARIPGQQPGDAQRFLHLLGYRLYRIRRGGRLEQLEQVITTGAAMILATRCLQ